MSILQRDEVRPGHARNTAGARKQSALGACDDRLCARATQQRRTHYRSRPGGSPRRETMRNGKGESAWRGTANRRSRGRKADQGEQRYATHDDTSCRVDPSEL